MLRAFLPVLVALWTTQAGTPPAPSRGDPDLEEGVRQAQEGEYDRAVVTLDGVVRRIRQGGGTAAALSRAQVYLGVAYLGLNQEQAARTSFEAALRTQPSLTLSADEYPPRVVRVFEDVRRSSATAAAPPKAPAAAAEEKGGSRKPLILLGAAGVAAGGAALALGGGGGGGGSSTSTPVTPSNAVVTGTVTLAGVSPPAGSTIRVSGRSIASGSGLLQIQFDVVTSADVSGVTLRLQMMQANGVVCAYTFKQSLSFHAGQHATVLVDSFTLEYDPPFETTHMQVWLTRPPSEDMIANVNFNSTGWAFASP
jgi:hypothetical protein